MTPIHNLIRGYRQFYQKYFTSGDTLYHDLATAGQSPKTLIIACSDSRVDPSIITDARPGDIFVVRNVANLVPPFEADDTGQHGVSAAVEFGVRVLGVEHIIVLGHSKCAGIEVLLKPDVVQETDFIGKWVSIAEPARERALKSAGTGELAPEHYHMCEQESILLSLHNLLTFPWIKDKIQSKSLQLHGWYFSITDGTLKQYNPIEDVFESVD